MLTKAETKDKESARQLCQVSLFFSCLQWSNLPPSSSSSFILFFPIAFSPSLRSKMGQIQPYVTFLFLNIFLCISVVHPLYVYVQIHSQPLSSCLTFPLHLSFLFLPPHFFFFWIICCRCHKSSLCLFVARNRHADRQRGRQKDKQAHEEWKTILYEDTEKQTEVRGLRGPD